MRFRWCDFHTNATENKIKQNNNSIKTQNVPLKKKNGEKFEKWPAPEMAKLP